MAESPLRTRLQASLFFGRDGLRSLLARLRGQSSRRHAALDYVQAHATRGNPASVLAALDEFGRNKRFLMNIGDEKGPLLKEQLALAGSGGRILELGGYIGYSAVLIAQGLENVGYLVSLEKDPVSADIAGKIIDFAGLGSRVDLRVGDSGELIPQLQGPFDLVLLDHWKDLYTRDLKLLEQHALLRPGSTVFADNVGPIFNPESYLDYVRNCGRYESRYVSGHIEYSSLEDGVEISVFRG